MASKQCCYIGRGKIYAREYVETCGSPAVLNENSFLWLGNVSDFRLTIEEETITQKDYTNCGGGAECSASFIDTVNVSLQFNCWSAKNLGLAFYGSAANIVGATAFTETFHIGDDVDCAFVPLTYIPDETNTAIVVSGPGGAPVYTLGTDYIVTPSGIELAVGSTIPANSDIEITYDYKDSDCIELLTGQSKEIELFFDGKNCAEGDKPFSVKLYKVTLTPATDIGFISDEFGSFTLTGTVLKDNCIVSSNNPFSQYGKIQF